MHLKFKRNTRYSMQNTRYGFTLIELLITIFLASVGLIGILAFFNSSIQSQFDAKNEVIAVGLAQEGPELVRNLAEYKKLKGDSWATISSYLNGCVRIDRRSATGTPRVCNNGISNNVCFVGGVYRQCDSGETGIGMTRKIDAVYNSAENYLEIISTVQWGDRKTIAKDIIYENIY